MKELKDATHVSYSIRNEVLGNLHEYCRMTGTSKTGAVETAIRTFLSPYTS